MLLVDPGQELLDEQVAKASIAERTAWARAKREAGMLLVWQQADAAGVTDPVVRADFMLRRLYPEMPEAWLTQTVSKLAALRDAGEWHGFVRPDPITAPDAR